MHITVTSLTFAAATCALQCYDCSYFRLETGNPAVDTVLGPLSRISDTNCQFENEDDYTKVDIRYDVMVLCVVCAESRILNS